MKSAWRSGDAEGQGAGPAALVELLVGASGAGLGGDVSGELLLVEAGVAPGDVPMEDGLACGFADVDADVEAVGVVTAGEELSALVDGGCYGGSLLRRGVEPGRDVPSRDDQQVAFAHREGIPEGPREPVFEGDAAPGLHGPPAHSAGLADRAPVVVQGLWGGVGLGLVLRRGLPAASLWQRQRAPFASG
jgi:hypothetical protein